MKSPITCLRLMFVFALILFVLGLAPQYSLAQTVAVSPQDLSFAIPTIGTPPPLPATSLIQVTISGTGTYTLSGFTITPITLPADFVINGNGCPTTPQAITGTAYCYIGVQFTSKQAAGVLETATLSFQYSTTTIPGPTTINVPLNGAYGAIKLFGPVDVNLSLFSGVTWPTSAGNSVGMANVNLSCGPSPTAVLSSTPDGSSNVFQDNTIQVTNTIIGDPTTTTNVCYGGDTNFEEFTGFPTGTTNCFQPAYESAAAGFIGDNPDTTPGLVSTYGVPPLNLQNSPTYDDTGTPLYPAVLVSGNQSLSVQLTDAGGDLGAATLHLVTNCEYAGLAPGGSITGNPTPMNTLSFGPGVTLEDNTSDNPPPSGTTPIATDIAIPQQLFYQLTNGTSAAPSVCFRISTEKDTYGNPMCKGFQIQCKYTDPATGITTTNGDNCDPSSSSMRDLYDTLLLDSPDAPVPPVEYNYLYVPTGNPAADACSYYLKGVPFGSCALLTGPGILMFGDNAMDQAGVLLPTPWPPLELTTMTPTSPASYSTANCVLTGFLTGDLCPLNTLTSFLGGDAPSPGGGTQHKNSILVAVANMPLPFVSKASIKNENNGWVTTTSPTVSFTASPAVYLGLPVINPPANNFKQAPLYSVTYGTSLAPSLPDTTAPILTDTTLYNTGVNTGFGTPLCPSAPSGPFSPTGTIVSPTDGVLGNGIYNLHFFATDCALSEGLVFLPNASTISNVAANWASFQYETFGVDTITPNTPVVTLSGPSGPYPYHGTGPTVSVSCTTAGPSGLRNCGTSLSTNLLAAGYPAVGHYSTYTSSVITLPTKAHGLNSVTFYARSEAGLMSSYTYSYTVQ